MNQGETLKRELKRLGTSPDDFAKTLKVGRTIVFNWFKMAVIPDHYRELITKQLGKNIFDSQENHSNEIQDKYVHSLEETVKDLRFLVSVLKGEWKPAKPNNGTA